jgi:hypothetical protein
LTELGDTVETVFVENVAEADADRSIERLARMAARLFSQQALALWTHHQGCCQISDVNLNMQRATRLLQT